MVRKFPPFRSERKKRSTSEGTPQFPNGISGKLPYHLTSNRNFRIFLPNRELTNRRLLPDAAVRLRDMLTAHAYLCTCQPRAKDDDVVESDLPASWKQEDVRLVFKVFSRYVGHFCQI